MIKYIFLLCLVLLSACGIENVVYTTKTPNAAYNTENAEPVIERYEAAAIRDHLNARREDMPFYNLFSKDIGSFYAEYGGADSEIYAFGNNVDIAIPRSESVYFWLGREDTTPSEAAFELLTILLEDVSRASTYGSDFFYRLTDFEIGIQTPLDWEALLNRELDMVLPHGNDPTTIDWEGTLEHIFQQLLPLGENMWVFTPVFSYEYTGVAELRRSNGAPVSFQGADKYILMVDDGVWRLQSLSSLVKMYDSLKPNVPTLGEAGRIPDNIRLPDELSVKAKENGALLLQNTDGIICGCGAMLEAGSTEFENGKIVSLLPLVNHAIYTTPLIPVEGGAVVRIELDIYDDRGMYLPLTDAYWCIVAQTDDSAPAYALLLSADEFTLTEALNVLSAKT